MSRAPSVSLAVVVPLVLHAPLASPADRDESPTGRDRPIASETVAARGRDGLLAESSALPRPGTVRLHGAAHASGASPVSVVDLAWAFAPRFMATAYGVFPSWQLQALAGASLPRGLARAGATGAVAAVFEL